MLEDVLHAIFDGLGLGPGRHIRDESIVAGCWSEEQADDEER